MGCFSKIGWVGLLSVLLVGCFSPQSTSNPPQAAAPEPAIAPSPSPSPSSPAVDEAPATEAPAAVADEWPETQAATLSVEGEAEEISMVLYDAPAAPFITYLPAGDFVGETLSSGEGVGVRFTWTAGGTPDENVYMLFAFPAEPMAMDSLRDFVVGDGGLMASNGWSVTETQTDDLPAEWAKEAIAFQVDGDPDLTGGVILLGEHDGELFYSIMHYPIEYAEGFYPRASLVLDYLEFKP